MAISRQGNDKRQNDASVLDYADVIGHGGNDTINGRRWGTVQAPAMTADHGTAINGDTLCRRAGEDIRGSGLLLGLRPYEES